MVFLSREFDKFQGPKQANSLKDLVKPRRNEGRVFFGERLPRIYTLELSAGLHIPLVMNIQSEYCAVCRVTLSKFNSNKLGYLAF